MHISIRIKHSLNATSRLCCLHLIQKNINYLERQWLPTYLIYRQPGYKAILKSRLRIVGKIHLPGRRRLRSKNITLKCFFLLSGFLRRPCLFTKLSLKLRPLVVLIPFPVLWTKDKRLFNQNYSFQWIFFEAPQNQSNAVFCELQISQLRSCDFDLTVLAEFKLLFGLFSDKLVQLLERHVDMHLPAYLVTCCSPELGQYSQPILFVGCYCLPFSLLCHITYYKQ